MEPTTPAPGSRQDADWPIYTGHGGYDPLPQFTYPTTPQTPWVAAPLVEDAVLAWEDKVAAIAHNDASRSISRAEARILRRLNSPRRRFMRRLLPWRG